MRAYWALEWQQWWTLAQLSAMVLLALFTPSSYSASTRHATLVHMYRATWPLIPWFTALVSLCSLVLIRIIVVTAQSYGLTQFALQLVVRVLVLELIPLSAALYVALRLSLGWNGFTPRRLSASHLHSELVPRVLAHAFSVVSLALVSCVVTLVFAYVNVYGITPWGLPAYTRTVGQVFAPDVALGFALKVGLFSAAVALVPMAAKLKTAALPSDPTTLAVRIEPGAVRLLVVLLLIESASLAVKYL